jgi:hypothetical protein
VVRATISAAEVEECSGPSAWSGSHPLGVTTARVSARAAVRRWGADRQFFTKGRSMSTVSTELSDVAELGELQPLAATRR